MDGSESLLDTLRPHYRSGDSDLRSEFFNPCLSCCEYYQRAVGFFSSSALASWAAVLPRIANNDHIRIQLLISPELSEADYKAIQAASDPKDRDAILQDKADRILLDALAFATDTENLDLRLRLLIWLIASERLELRFAFPTHVPSPGIFHEKIGVFGFPDGRSVAFTGSANESASGHTYNYETVDVFRSWVAGDSDRVGIKKQQFASAWNGVATGLRVLPLSEETLRMVRVRAPKERPDTSGHSHEEHKWRHQDEAVTAFLGSERGILEMATGTGKTRTALKVFKSLSESGGLQSLIVAADGTDLLDQWYGELIQCAKGLSRRFLTCRHYGTNHEREMFDLNPSGKILLCSRQALPPALRNLSAAQAQNVLLIHDEVHSLGSRGNRASLSGLSDQIRYCLGLSATPEREYDVEGNDFIEGHIGEVIYSFGLEDAISRGILAPFSYYPLEYEIDEDDRLALQRVYRRAAARKNQGEPMSEAELWTELSRVYKVSKAKLPVFETFLSARQDLLGRCIIFVETKEYGEEVLSIVHRFRTDFHTYFDFDKKDVLQRFARGDLECLITCHRLSEGIDIRNLQNVVLLSSSRARLETIQRMGRCLRTDPENPAKRANVVDFVRVDEEGEAQEPDSSRRQWLRGLSHVQPQGED